MIVVKSAKPQWHKAREVWRLDISYVATDGSTKRTFVNIPGVTKDATKGAAEAKREAKAFDRGLSQLYRDFRRKMDGAAYAPTELSDDAPTGLSTPVAATPKAKVVRPTEPTIAWLLDECLKHPKIWGRVKHPKNYVSGVRILNGIIGGRECREFEVPHGGAIVREVLATLQASGKEDGYCRKIMYQLRQALMALVGKGLAHPIVHPVTGEQIINDVPTFPDVERGKPRTTVLKRGNDKVVWECIAARQQRAAEEERAYAKSRGKTLFSSDSTGSVEVDGEIRWLNSRRYSSSQWRSFGRFVRFLIETGMRRTEALMTGSHSVGDRYILDDDGNVIETYQVLHIPADHSKSGVERDINMTPWVQEHLFEFRAFAEPISFKFRDKTHTVQHSWFKLTPSQVTSMWRHIRTDALTHGVDIDQVVLHSLRHTFATRMSEKGMHGKLLQEALGHADDRTTRVYDHAQQVANSRKFYARDVGANPTSNPS